MQYLLSVVRGTAGAALKLAGEEPEACSREAGAQPFQ